ncbi:hypothetical protein Q7A53_14815 [Halobacillus rhizosphaerae]|uniref:hypothetical protein n=1 Tax=Halobacillus rhizosphaerae TaxID=3064889 RepID=UPI00398AD519
MSRIEISKERFHRVENWIKRNARPLEAAQWQWMFKGGSRDLIISYLSAFQNEDGGFGHGLEPDFWLPDSSPMATWTAGQLLIEVEASPEEEIVQGLVSYLTDTCQEDWGMWPSVLPENNQFPHAPWWHWREGVQENWMFNPSIELAAFLIHWTPERSKSSLLGWKSIERAIPRLMECKEMDSHEINNYQHFVQLIQPFEASFNSNLPYTLKEVSNKILILAEQSMEKQVSSWSVGYKALPLDFIHGPDHPLCGKMNELIQSNLNFYIAKLPETGVWDISWKWGEYENEFAVARRYWQGILAIKRFKKLELFGCLQK